MIISEQIDHAKFQAYCKKCTDNQLRYIIKDCRDTMDAWERSWFEHHPNEGKYLDQLNYAASELHRRKMKAAKN